MTKATAQMGGLTREDVDVVIGKAINACVVDCKPDTCHCELVRDLAYAAIESDPITVGDVAEAIVEDRQRQSLSLESVRSEARSAALEEAARACPAEATSYECRQRIRALSPARVAEGKVCPSCKGSGNVRGMTHGHGPDDYEIDVECPDCKGTGGESPAKEQPWKKCDNCSSPASCKWENVCYLAKEQPGGTE